MFPLRHIMVKVYKQGAFNVVNRPGVAGAALQTPLLLINYLSEPFPPNL